MCIWWQALDMDGRVAAPGLDTAVSWAEKLGQQATGPVEERIHSPLLAWPFANSYRPVNSEGGEMGSNIH